MEGAPALLAQLGAASSLTGDLDAADAGGDEAPPVLRVTPASRAAWSAIFRQHVMGARRGGDTDDMLFFVRVPANLTEPFFALRHDSKQVPPPEAADVNWEESCYLNLIMHNLEYTMEESKFVSKVLGTKVSKKVYAAPNHAPIDGKSKAESMELTYPFIYFRVDDHDEIWRDVRLQAPDQIIAVELFAQGPIAGAPTPAGAPRHKLFSGALSFEAIQHAVKEKNSAFSLSGPPAQHFFKLRGPRGKGTAQLCVKRPGAEAATGLGAWALSLLRSSEEDASGPFVCSITWLSVSWHSIMRDVLRSGTSRGGGAAAP